MRISDWSSDVCSSDLQDPSGIGGDNGAGGRAEGVRRKPRAGGARQVSRAEGCPPGAAPYPHRSAADQQGPRRAGSLRRDREIGRASGRERVRQYVRVQLGGDTLKKKEIKHNTITNN